jgi:hypothetical protein
MHGIAPSHVTFALYSSRVAYLIAAKPEHATEFERVTAGMQAAWGDGIRYLHLT